MSKNNDKIKDLHGIVTALTRRNDIGLHISDKVKTASYNPESNTIILTYNIFADKIVELYPLITSKLLDGLLIHECGHAVLTNPYNKKYKRWSNKYKYDFNANYDLAKFAINIIEDKRINHYMLRRYRFDMGKRLSLLMEYMNKSWVVDESHFKSMDKKTMQSKLFFGILVSKGLYNCDYSQLVKYLNKRIVQDLEQCFKLLEEVKYTRVWSKMVSYTQRLFDIMKKYVAYGNNLQYVPQMNNGTYKPSANNKIHETLKELEKSEKKRLKELAKLNAKAHGKLFGKGKGIEIPSPEPNLQRYFALVNKNAEEIQRLIKKLKLAVQPTITRKLYAKHGRIIKPLLAKAYTNSLRHRVQRVYEFKETRLEDKKVVLSLIVDFSGSMNRYMAECALTILSEVFGKYVEDKSYAIYVFGKDYQKIKTPFETYSKTRGRIGNITVDVANTNLSKLLSQVITTTLGINSGNRTKVIIIVSDFGIHDSLEVTQQLNDVKKYTDIILIGVPLITSKQHAQKYMDNCTETIKDISELPDYFTDVWSKAVKNKSII